MKPTIEGGYRLGGHAKNSKLAASARAFRKFEDFRNSKEEKGEILNEEAGAQNSFIIEHAVLLHVLLPEGSIADEAPEIQPEEFIIALGLEHGLAHVEWSELSKSCSHRVVCVRIMEEKLANDLFEKFSRKQVNRSYRKLFHLGQAVHVHAVSRERVFPCEQAFQNSRSALANFVDPPNPPNPPPSFSIKGMSFPDIVDMLGDDIVEIESIFVKFSRGKELICGIQLKKAIKALSRYLQTRATHHSSTEKFLSLADFCKIAISLSKR